MVITVVTIVLCTSLFLISLLSLLSGHLIIQLGHFLCLHSPIVLSVDTLLSPVVYCPMCRTIARTCISSVACTPWYCSSLNCSARLVVYFSFNPLVLSTALPDILSLLYLLDTCCVSHTHLANTMWVSTHTPMLFINLHLSTQMRCANSEIRIRSSLSLPFFLFLLCAHSWLSSFIFFRHGYWASSKDHSDIYIGP